MKTLSSFIILLFCIIGNDGFAQAPYTGGSDDGYASKRFDQTANFIADSNRLQGKITVYPNPLPQHEELQLILAQAPSGHLTIAIADLAGKIALKNEYNLINSQSVCLDTKYLQKGTYLITVKTQNYQATFRLLIL